MLVITIGGLAAGMLHVLSGPDHLAAVAPLAADTSGSRWRAGFSWGIGHTSGVLFVGVLALLLRDVLPMNAISSWSERLVGVALIAVGLWGARRAFRTRVHVHSHVHDGSVHSHVHFHGTGAVTHASRAGAGPAHRHTHLSFVFGVLHGLAGSSHVLGILPALALPTREASITYLLAYGVGNVTAMTGFASAIGFVAARAEGGGVQLYRGLLATCSVAAIAVGAIWLIT
jgi:hypothetical protein